MGDLTGKYYSKNITTAGVNQDLVSTLRTLSGDASLTTIKKLTLVTAATITISINGGAFSDLYPDLDNISHLSLDGFDCLISSLVVHETGSDVFIAVIY